MRSLIIRISLLLVLFSLEVHADDSIQSMNSRYQMRTENNRSFWRSLVPSQVVMQNAGNMGLLSVGLGWDYGKHEQWETHLLLGFVPKNHSKSVKTTFTVKENLIPWRTMISDQWRFEPLTCSFYLTTIFGNEFWSHQPSRYPNNYYPFSTKIRINLSVGERITFILPEKKKWVKRMTAFYEIGSCDLYLIDYFSNKQVGLKDVLGLSLGLKMDIF